MKAPVRADGGATTEAHTNPETVKQNDPRPPPLQSQIRASRIIGLAVAKVSLEKRPSVFHNSRNNHQTIEKTLK